MSDEIKTVPWYDTFTVLPIEAQCPREYHDSPMRHRIGMSHCRDERRPSELQRVRCLCGIAGPWRERRSDAIAAYNELWPPHDPPKGCR